MSISHAITFSPDREEILSLKGEGRQVMRWEELALRAVTREDIREALEEKGSRKNISPDELYLHTLQFLANKYRRMLVAYLEPDKRILGDVSFTEADDSEDMYFGIDVKPKYQGYGFGTKLSKMSIEYARDHYHDIVDRLLLRVDTQNARAIHVYQKAGFTIADERPYIDADSRMERTEYIMQAIL